MQTVNDQEVRRAVQSALLPGHNLAMIHSSIKMFGYEDNIIDKFIDAWTAETDKLGYTIAMPTFTWSYCKTRVYHGRNTPGETGILSEQFRKRENVIRGRHPIFSFAGYGHQAKEFVAHPGETCWGQNTPFDYINKNNGLLIVFGVGFDSLTFCHHIEEMNLVPYHYYKTFKGKADYGKGLIEVAPKYHVRSLNLPSGSDFSLIFSTLEKEGKIKTIQLGESFIKVVKARDVYALGCRLIKKDPYIFLVDKNEYLKVKKRPFFVFLGSSNLDGVTDEFEKAYSQKTKNKCRTMKVPFGRYKEEIVDPDSDICLEKPDYVVFCERVEDIFRELFGFEQREFESRLRNYVKFIKQARKLLSGIFFIMNFSPLGNVSTHYYWKLKEMIDYANNFLFQELQNLPSLYILPYDKAVNTVGRENAFSGKDWFVSQVPFSLKLTKVLCDYIFGACLFLEGKTIRLVIVDLDNTLWGGIIEEDGISGIKLGPDYPGNCFVNYQKLLKAWLEQGKILAVVGKNIGSIALEVIEKHLHMVLREKDFAIIKLNGKNKVESIKEICQELSLDFSSVCFIDDSPFERQQVRGSLPEVFVPDMPKDVAEWTNFLSRLPQFEVLNYEKKTH